jgi:hypothetical protein
MEGTIARAAIAAFLKGDGAFDAAKTSISRPQTRDNPNYRA